MAQSIVLRGVRQNNLKNINVEFPLGKLTVVTGLSGAGKSSLVFDTLHAEGQRRYVETFSAYTRQFMELLDAPQVDQVDHIPPSIAIQQGNTVKTSRSTVGTMTELCDYFKVWFAHEAELIDPVSGKVIAEEGPQSVWKKVLAAYQGSRVLLGFALTKPKGLASHSFVQSLQSQGYSRLIVQGALMKLTELEENALAEDEALSVVVVQDRILLESRQRSRFLEAAQTAFQFGQGSVVICSDEGELRETFHTGLYSAHTQVTYRSASPALFSFNSPLGACPACRGFGRVIEIDYNLVIPDHTLSLAEGAVKAFQGAVYGESQQDMLRAAKRCKIPVHKPWAELTAKQKDFVLEGEPAYDEESSSRRQWYGVRRFFDWLESNTYKMHVRIFLSKFRSYVVCPSCGGTRLQPESLLWRWQGYRLPDLYAMPVGDLLPLLEQYSEANPPSHDSATQAMQAIRQRLRYLIQVGLDYLSLDRTSRTLSGGEVQRVNLTACLGTSLVDTLFVLDEPSVGLHARDMDRLIEVLRELTGLGNTVVVVEHDEAIMRAADYLMEIGPQPGREGGHVVFAGSYKQMLRHKQSVTGRYLSGKERVPLSLRKTMSPKLRQGIVIEKASKHNIANLSARIPLHALVGVTGVSGSGKSTLLNNVIHQGLLAARGMAVSDVASMQGLHCAEPIHEVVLVDQSPLSRTPRSNPALYVDAWNTIRELFAKTEAAKQAGYSPSTFSFNSGDGRCEACNGLGYEKVEMQFLSDVYVECPHCNGQRFKESTLAVKYLGKNVAEVLAMTVSEAILFFEQKASVVTALQALESVGLGYLTLGQPLNTLSGGESQRLKLVKYLARFRGEQQHALLLLDEPTTGLHRHDVVKLIAVLQELVQQGHSVLVVEHQLDVLAACDWLLEMGPDSGASGGKLVAEGTPVQMMKKKTHTAQYLQAHVQGDAEEVTVLPKPTPVALHAYQSVKVVGAREHNLKDISVEIPHGKITVVTGVSGSGKSSLAFDIIFAEGQRRFMESMSAYTRQFVEQLPKPDLDALQGIAPTVAIEQRVTRGTHKSTVATITEVAQYLRLLYSRIGIQHNPRTGNTVGVQTRSQIVQQLQKTIAAVAAKDAWQLCAPLVRSRKGHHEPIATWAKGQGYQYLRCDGELVALSEFKKLDRYKEHDVDLVYQELIGKNASEGALSAAVDVLLRMGKGSFYAWHEKSSQMYWFSSERMDAETGEAFPALDPKDFSWNSPRGWCPTCRGYGRIYAWMKDDDQYGDDLSDHSDGELCPSCQGKRLKEQSCHVYLFTRSGESYAMPDLLQLTPSALVAVLRDLDLDKRSASIARDIIAQVEERIHFMDEVGLSYLTLDRATGTLSGGEAQRIRLASQLGSNLSGVLYVLDEPSIGLHSRDNALLMQSIAALKQRGNTILIVEHDDEVMRAADCIIDMGPAAGVHGGEILAKGTWKQVTRSKKSLTGQFLAEGIAHPLRGEYRALPKPFKRYKAKAEAEWLVLTKARLRNLQGDDLHIPLRRLTMVCGVSGAGKSTLVRDLLQRTVKHSIAHKVPSLTGKQYGEPVFDRLLHGNTFNKVIEVDQNPIGKTLRSCPATYIGAFDLIRNYFAELPEANMRGYNAGTFSFNTKGGRCETCKGNGKVKLAMNFLPDTFIDCDDCGGSRYGAELQDVRWKGKNIGEVLQMSFKEAAEFFDFHSRLHAMMNLMVETGLGYLELGQSSPTLSGGEAQRLKLVSELIVGLPTFTDLKRGRRNHNLYILEEPTIGLHLSDCQRLIELLHRLVDQGHTVVVIEHHLDLIQEGDYIVEVGPDGGAAGGQILYQGPLAGLRTCEQSVTAPFLA